MSPFPDEEALDAEVAASTLLMGGELDDDDDELEGMDELLTACAAQRASGSLVIDRADDRVVLLFERGQLVEASSRAVNSSSRILTRSGRLRISSSGFKSGIMSGELDSSRPGGLLGRTEDVGEPTPPKPGARTPGSDVRTTRRRSGGSGRTTPPAADRPLDPGTEIGKYCIESLLGRGGRGHVYRARHILLDTPVAVKIVDPSLTTAFPGTIGELMAEARLCARLNHPNIVHVTDLIHIDGNLGIVMELVEGQTLREVISERGRVDAFDAVSLGIDIASALGEASGYGLVHRDVKPSNIMLAISGTAKLLDLGLARRFIAHGDGHGGEDVALEGTPLYMAPEQFLNPEHVNFRSDMFSLGVTLYEALVGEPPVSSNSLTELVFKRTEETVIPPHERVDTVPEALSILIMELLDNDPDERPGGYDIIVRRLRGMHEALIRGDADRVSVEGLDSREEPHVEQGAEAEGFDARHVLVVEDSRVNQLLIRRVLEDFDYRVSVAGDGVEALELIRKTRFGAILMDCELPRMDGYTATRLARSLEAGRGYRTPIIALTGKILPGDRRRAHEAGMDDFLAKPVNRDRLEAALAHWQRRLGVL